MSDKKETSDILLPDMGHEETILEYFIKHTNEDKSVKNIIRVLSFLNAQLMISGVVSKSAKEIFDFGNYFIANGFEEFTRKERKKSFCGKEAMILNIYYEIAQKLEYCEVLETIKEMTVFEKNEARTLSDTIFNIKENKIVTLSTLEGPIEFKYLENFTEKEEEALKKEFYNYMAYAIKLKTAGIIVRVYKSASKQEVFGINIINGMWSPLSREKLIERFCSPTTKKTIKYDKETECTEIMRELF